MQAKIQQRREAQAQRIEPLTFLIKSVDQHGDGIAPYLWQSPPIWSVNREPEHSIHSLQDCFRFARLRNVVADPASSAQGPGLVIEKAGALKDYENFFETREIAQA